MLGDNNYLYYQPYIEEFLSSGYVGLLEGMKSYNELTNIFGLKHHGVSGDFKVQWGWEWKFVMDTRPTRMYKWFHATVYNWKDGPCYIEGGVTQETEYDRDLPRPWHIGGADQLAVDLVNLAVRQGDHPRHFVPPGEAEKDGQLILFK